MPLPLFPLLLGKLAIAGGIGVLGHKLARHLERPSHYAALTPVFDPTLHLNGLLTTEGTVHGPTGKVATRFQGTLEGHWEGNKGTLVERHTLDGTPMERTWTLLRNGNSITGLNSDGAAVKGTLSGNSLSLIYPMSITTGGRTINVTVEDWFYLMESGTLMNRAVIRKLGFPLGDIAAILQKKQT